MLNMTSRESEETTKKDNARWLVKVDQELCAGCGTCTYYAKKIFGLSDDGVATVKKNTQANDLQAVIKAAENCPNGAIIIEDTQTGKSYS